MKIIRYFNILCDWLSAVQVVFCEISCLVCFGACCSQSKILKFTQKTLRIVINPMLSDRKHSRHLSSQQKSTSEILLTVLRAHPKLEKSHIFWCQISTDFLEKIPPLKKSPLVPGRLELPHCKILGDFPTLKKSPLVPGGLATRGEFFQGNELMQHSKRESKPRNSVGVLTQHLRRCTLDLHF